MWMLEQWKSTLPAVLQLSPEGLSTDPAVCLLHMRYNQLVIIATRPLFFIAIKNSVAARLTSQTGPNMTVPLDLLKACIESARSNMRLARHSTAISRHGRPLHTLLHYSFTAACCLILQDLVHDPTTMSLDELQTRTQDVQFAMTLLQQQEACIKWPDNSKTCESTLQDLQVLVARLSASPQQSGPSYQTNIAQLQAMGLADGGFQPPPMHIETEPALYNELVTWMDDEWLMYNTYMQ